MHSTAAGDANRAPSSLQQANSSSGIATTRALAIPVVGLATTQIVGWGTVFTPLSVYATDIGRDLGLSREWVFAGITVMLLTGATLSHRCGKAVDRSGARSVMAIGSVIMSVALLAMALSSGLLTYLFAWVVAGLAMPMMLSNAALPGLVQVVGMHARRAITALMLLNGLSSTVFLPYCQWLLNTYGWRTAYMIFAVMHLVICLPLHLTILVRRTPDSDRGVPKGGSTFSDGILPAAQRRRAFLMLATWSCTEGLLTWGLYIQIIDIFKALGLSTAAAIGVWTLVGPCQALARFADLVTGGRTPILATALMSAVMTTSSFVFLLPFDLSLSTATMFAVTMGLGHGLFAIARNTLPLTLFGSREFGTYLGLLLVPQNVINAAAPIIFAWIIARLSPDSALWLSFAAALSGCVAVVFLNMACRVQPQPAEQR